MTAASQDGWHEQPGGMPREQNCRVPTKKLIGKGRWSARVRQWFDVARRKLRQIGYEPHPVNQANTLISMLGLRVDDLLGGGDGVSRNKGSKKGRAPEVAAPTC